MMVNQPIQWRRGKTFLKLIQSRFTSGFFVAPNSTFAPHWLGSRLPTIFLNVQECIRSVMHFTIEIRQSKGATQEAVIVARQLRTKMKKVKERKTELQTTNYKRQTIIWVAYLK